MRLSALSHRLGRLLPCLLLAASAHAFQIEAETGTLNLATIGTTRAGYSGTGYVTDIHDDAASITLTFPIDQAGNYAVRLRYASEYGDKFARLVVNGMDRGEASLPQSADWATSQPVVVPLILGTNTLQIQRDWGWYDVDAVVIDYLPPAGNEYEAELGTLSGATIGNSRAGYSGSGYVTGLTQWDSSVTLPVNLPQTGVHQIKIRYASPYGDKKTRVYVDGVDRGEFALATTAADAWSVADGPTLSLTAGAHSVKLEADWGWYDVDRIDLDYVPPAVGTEFEAETGTLSGGAGVDTSRAGYSGTGYVTNFASADASVAIPINLASAGTYQLVLRAASPWGEKYARILVNGEDQGEVYLPQNADWADVSGPIVFLPKGLGTVTIVRDWGYYDVDRIQVVAVPPPTFDLKTSLIDAKAAPETIALFAYLRAQFGRMILSGQTEDANVNANLSIDYIHNLTGVYPAIRVQDMMFYGTVARWYENTPERGIDWTVNKGGIIAMQWHWHAPDGANNDFYTAGTTFDIRKAVDPTQPEYALALREIDSIAHELGKYAAARVPILWRPLHEAEGGWFWWGAHGPEPAKAMWRLLYDRLTNYHGLHNLIWVWNSVDPAWYPGDDYVDIVSTDIYRTPGSYVFPPTTFYRLADLGGHRKIVALSENGPLPDIQALVDAGTPYAYFATWYGSHIMDGVSNSPAHVQEVFGHPSVVTLDELPNLRPAAGAQLFTDLNYAGTKVDLPQGDYTAQAIQTRGIAGGVVKSLTVPRGYRVIVYSGDNFTGMARTFATSFGDLPKVGYSGPVGSIRVRRN